MMALDKWTNKPMCR